MGLAITLTSASGFAADVTQQFSEFFNTRFIGKDATASREWDYRKCVFGVCTGEKVYGSSKGWVTELASSTGHGWIVQEKTDPWTGYTVADHWVDFHMTFLYSGDVTGTKQCFPGDFFCGYQWNGLNTAGRIVMDLTAKGEAVLVKLRYDVIGNHGDGPNDLTKASMFSLKPVAKSIVEQFMIANGTTTPNVTIID